MSFTTDETGYDTANPIELYNFIGTLGSYTYTSGNREIVFNSDTYLPQSIQRSGIILGDVSERVELKVYMPQTLQVVVDYGFDIPPPSLILEVYRMHGPDAVPQPWFQGKVAAITMERGKAVFTIPSIFSAYMSIEFPNVYYQSQCNHPLYSSGCGKSRADFTTAGVINSIIDRTTLSIPAAADKDSQYFRAGEIITTTERRLIVDHSGSIIKLNYPFRTLAEGQSVNMYAGCDHSIETCNSKFNNLVNFLGFPYTPSLNPFLKGL